MLWLKVRWVSTALFVIFVSVGVAVALSSAADTSHKLEKSDADRIQIRAEFNAQRKVSTALADQLERLDEIPVVKPSDPPPVNQRFIPIPGPTGPAGASITGRPGKQGKAGESITGLPGLQGGLGPKGDTGERGEKGDGPSDEQIAKAVADYCDAHNECKGDAAPTPEPTPAPIAPIAP